LNKLLKLISTPSKNPPYVFVFPKVIKLNNSGQSHLIKKIYKDLSLVINMNKVVGYVFAVVGLVVMVIGYGIINLNVKFLEGVKSSYVTIFSLILIAVGVAIVMMDNGLGKKNKKEKQSEDEVPIYQGSGKNRKIVGYRRG
jgi:sulfite exporter TauE/SafE